MYVCVGEILSEQTHPGRNKKLNQLLQTVLSLTLKFQDT